MRKIILLGARTGGPIKPLEAIAKNLIEVEVVVIGVKNGFEKNIASKNNWKFISLPEAKLSMVIKPSSLEETVSDVLGLFRMFFVTIYNYFRALYILIKEKPKAVITSGSFFNIPFSLALKTINLFNSKKKILLITHQQDPLPGLSNRFVAKSSDMLTTVFPVDSKFANFKDAEIIPNPLDTSQFSKEGLKESQAKLSESHPALLNFILNSQKSILLVVGGGNGSQAFNQWTEASLNILTQNFSVIHLRGNQESIADTAYSDYYATNIVAEGYEYLLNASDIVLSRAGMSSISELLYAQKNAILIPIPRSHQAANASKYTTNFAVIEQDKIDQVTTWLRQDYTSFFDSLPKIDQNKYNQDLAAYYTNINDLLSS